MMISQATKAFTRCQTVTRLPSNSKVQPLLMVQRAFKETAAIKRCPEAKPKKSRKLITTAAVAVFGTTVAVVTAKNDDEFRDWTRENLPALENLVKAVYEEEETHPELIVRLYKELTQRTKQVLYDAFQGTKKQGEGKRGGASPVKDVCDESKKPYQPPESAFLVEEDKKEVADSSLSNKSVASVPRHMKEFKDLEDKLGHTAQDIIQACHAAVCSMKEQASYIDNLDQLITKHDCKLWDRLEKKMKDGQKSLEKAETGMVSLQSIAEVLKSRIENDPNLTDDMKIKAKNNINIVMNDVKKARENLEKEKSKNVLAKRAWDKVRQARMHFSEELEMLFPNVWMNEEKLELDLDNLEPFLQHVLDSIVYLDKELAKLQTVKDAETSSGIERLKSTKDPEGVIYAAICLEGGKFKRTQQEDMKKTLLTHQAKCDKQARSAMKQQSDVYKDLRAEALAVKEREVERKMQLLLEESLADLRAEHKLQVAKLVGRIQGANEAIAKRGDKDKGQQERQQFWSATQSFLSVVKPLGTSAKLKESKPLKNEIANVRKAAPEQDELVQCVLESIPQQAVERGVESEERLKERFITLEREARKVAALPEGKVSLLQFFLARVQAALYVNEPIPHFELSDEPFQPDLLNNYEILYRARYYVDKGDLCQAVKYLNLLKGPSNKVASDWIKDVTAHLETRQAAEVLLAYASAIGLQT